MSDRQKLEWAAIRCYCWWVTHQPEDQVDGHLTDEHIRALAACVEVATPYDDDEIEGPTSDEHNSKPFEQWSPDRIAAVAATAVEILKHMKATGQLDLPTT